jgi:chemotaxis protein methyltransferase CheR
MTMQLSDVDFTRFQSLIYKESGIHLSPSKRAMLAGRLSKRLRALEIEVFHDYLQRVERSPDELTQMLDIVTTNETRFFREQKQFDHLRDSIIPRWHADAGEGRTRWPCCSWPASARRGTSGSSAPTSPPASST